MAKGTTKRMPARLKAAMGSPAQRRKLDAAIAAFEDIKAIAEGRLRDPRNINRRLHDLHAVVSELIEKVPTNVEQGIGELQRSVAAWEQGAREWIEEAEALFAAVDNADFTTIEQHVRGHPPSPGAIGFLVVIARDRYKSKVARDNAWSRIAAREPAKQYILGEWERSGADYRSKADFVRVIHRFVRNRFPDIDVTSRTIERDWLPKGTGKPTK